MLIFRVFSGVKVQKNVPKWQKFLSFSLSISETMPHMIVVFDTHVWNEDISSIFFSSFFQNPDFSGF